MSTIFLSHADNDYAEALKVRDLLLAHGYQSIFLSKHPEDGIAGGDAWKKDLYQKIRSCYAMISLCSNDYFESSWCLVEVFNAQSEGKYIFPIKIKPCEISRILAKHQVIDLVENGEAGYETLWRGLEKANVKGVFELNPDRPLYPGLYSFEKEDAAVFFGRDDEIEHVRNQMNQMRLESGNRFLAIVGPSGSGKSSLVRAGLVPQLEREKDRWIVLPPFRPENAPFDRLSRVMADVPGFDEVLLAWDDMIKTEITDIRSGLRLEPVLKTFHAALKSIIDHHGHPEARVLIIIDQFEELLVSNSISEGAFLETIRAALSRFPDLFVMCTLRSDALGAFQKHDALIGMEIATFLLNPIPVDRMAEIIEGPASRAMIPIEPGLANRMILDAKMDDALPLLSFTLQEMRKSCNSDMGFTSELYEKTIGGVEGVISRVTKDILRELSMSPDQLNSFRLLFLKLVGNVEKGRCTRKSVPMKELLRILPNRQNEAVAILGKFVDRRLIVSDRADQERTLEVAHEALFRVWEDLASWIKAEKEFFNWRRELEINISVYENTETSQHCLLRDVKLKTALNYRSSHAALLEYSHIQFINRCEEEDARRKEREHKLRTRRVVILAAASCLAIALTILSFFYGEQALLLRAISEIENNWGGKVIKDEVSGDYRVDWPIIVSPEDARPVLGRIPKLVRLNIIPGAIPNEAVEKETWFDHVNSHLHELESFLMESPADRINLSLAKVRGFHTVPGLENFHNVSELDLSHTDFSDHEQLSSLQGLTRLNLSYSGIRNQLVLNQFTSLEKLEIQDLRITNLVGLDSMLNLRILDASGSDLKSLNLKVDVPALETIDLTAAESLTSIDKLNHFPALRNLILTRSHITNLSGLDHLNQLILLDATETQLTELPGLGALKALETLDIRHSSITRLENLDKLRALKTLHVGGSGIEALPGLEKLTNLAELVANEVTRMSGLPDLSSLTSLEHLNVSLTPITTLTGWTNLKNLVHFDADQSMIPTALQGEIHRFVRENSKRQSRPDGP